jgi:hypothetical protein
LAKSASEGQPVHLVYDDDIDQTLADICEQVLQRRPLHRAARKAAVVIGSLDELLSFASLAPDERLAGLALGVQRIRSLVRDLLLRKFWCRLRIVEPKA